MKRFIFFLVWFNLLLSSNIQAQINCNETTLSPFKSTASDCTDSIFNGKYTEWEKQKQGVVFITYKKDGSNIKASCTGTIINTTSNDKSFVYILTAAHCIQSENEANNAIIYFNYESTLGSDGAISNIDAVTGATKMAGSMELDYTLLKANIHPCFKIYYNGWDFSNTRANLPKAPLSCIHHPAGDDKKISFISELPSVGDFNVAGDEVTYKLNLKNNTHWFIKWAKGTVQGGSSGSPLFDFKKRQIGILSGVKISIFDIFDKEKFEKNPCDNVKSSYFQQLSAIYKEIQNYIDPKENNISSNTIKIDGYDPYNAENTALNSYESNNSIGEAEDVFPDFTKLSGIIPSTSIPFSGFLRSYIYDEDKNDEDYFKFTVKSKGTLTLKLKNLPANYDLLLVDESGMVLSESHSTGTGEEEVSYIHCPSFFSFGTDSKKVYAKIVGVDGAKSTTPYKLEVNWLPFGDSFEPNDNKDKATTTFTGTQIAPSNQTIESLISTSIDNDWYKVGIEGKGALTIDLQNLPQNYQLVLYSLDGKTILDKSLNNATANEHLSYTYIYDQSTIGYIRVYGESGDHDNCKPYKLIINWQPDGECQPITLLPPDITYASTSSSNDGKIVLNVSGGTGIEPLYKWSNGATTKVISNLDNGIYSVTVTGDDGCVATGNYEVKIVAGETAYCTGDIILTNPTGTFSDKSGTNDYTINSNCRWKITPLNARKITLRFTAFKLHPTDKVRIFDGSSNTAPLLAEYNADTIPPPVTSTGGTMYVQFISDGSNTSEGFSAAYSATIDDGINQITSFNLWFDNNFADKLNIDIAPRNTLTVQTNIPTHGLAVGLHSINFRFNDQYDQSSPVTTDLFVKTPPVTEGGSAGIVGYEYWFDNLFDNRLGSGFDPIETFNFNEALDVNELAYGLHSFNMRFIDNANNWSASITDLFVKEKATASGTAQIVGYEYWFDNQFSNKVSQTVAATPTYTLLSNLDVTGLAYGLHSFNTRFKDNTGQWSPTTTDLFVKEKTSTGTSRIVQFQYWFDDNFQDKIIQNVTPTDIYTLISSLNTSPLLDGDHTISFRFLDNAQSWSPITKDTFSINQSVFPVELTQFKGNCIDGKVSLQWQTATEQNSAYFDVLYSASPQTGWKSIATIAAKGNSTVVNDYSTTAQSLSRLSYYRLRQVDKDGSAHYSATIAVECKSKEHYLKVYPNPAHDMFMLETDTTEGALSVEILNNLGQTILKKTFNGVVLYPLEISLAGIVQSGAYMVKVYRGNGEMVGLKRLVVH